MKIQLENHTLHRARKRGVTEHEIRETISDGISIPAKQGRFAKSLVFSFQANYNNVFYEEKKVEVYYVIEHEIIITVTVYAFYGKFLENEL
jgi:hypothetical protein